MRITGQPLTLAILVVVDTTLLTATIKLQTLSKVFVIPFLQ